MRQAGWKHPYCRRMGGRRGRGCSTPQGSVWTLGWSVFPKKTAGKFPGTVAGDSGLGQLLPMITRQEGHGQQD